MDFCKFEGIKKGLLDAIEYTKGNKKNCIEHKKNLKANQDHHNKKKTSA